MALMAAHGIPLPADAGTTVPVFESLWCHIGDEQDVSADLSTLLRGDGRHRATLLDGCGERLAGPLRRARRGHRPAGGRRPRPRPARGAHPPRLPDRRHHPPRGDRPRTPPRPRAWRNAAMGYDEDGGLPTYTLSFGRPGRSRGPRHRSPHGHPRADPAARGRAARRRPPRARPLAAAARGGRDVRSTATASSSSGDQVEARRPPAGCEPRARASGRSGTASASGRPRSSNGCAGGRKDAARRGDDAPRPRPSRRATSSAIVAARSCGPRRCPATSRRRRG